MTSNAGERMEQFSLHEYIWSNRSCGTFSCNIMKHVKHVNLMMQRPTNRPKHNLIAMMDPWHQHCWLNDWSPMMQVAKSPLPAIPHPNFYKCFSHKDDRSFSRSASQLPLCGYILDRNLVVLLVHIVFESYQITVFNLLSQEHHCHHFLSYY